MICDDAMRIIKKIMAIIRDLKRGKRHPRIHASTPTLGAQLRELGGGSGTQGQITLMTSPMIDNEKSQRQKIYEKVTGNIVR